ncbi:hypothetical protein [Streptomyces sp. H27-H5]|uniref:hypothetical protein n=1 Tax=Streptomyces sp. H27-H5 TaxID=2996460 RepID=UPI00226E2F58|nr:hypothetical protein [Streptomyces sp. H27-H5]MCY0955821.1 hypothetical protein [Streptomyces sp. H27-H5]
MPYVDGSELKKLARTEQFLRRNEPLFADALRASAEHLEGSTRSLREQYQKGQEDPAVMAAQDASSCTNEGYKILAENAEQRAADMRSAVAEMYELLRPEEDDES